MPIKKSYLEQKRYYRVAKVLFWIIPFLAIIIFVLRNGGCFFVLPLGISYAAACILSVILDNVTGIVTGLALYFLTVKIAWKIFFYIFFGGLEDDTKKKSVVKAEPVGPAIQPTPASTPDWRVTYEKEMRRIDDKYKRDKLKDANVGLFIAFIIFIALIYLLLSGQSSPSGSSGGSSGSGGNGCIPTGCPANYPYYGCGKCWETFNLCHSRGTDTLTDDCSVCRKCP